MKHGGVGTPGVVLQVDAYAVDFGVEHALRSLNRRPSRSLHRHEDVSEGKPRDRWIGLPECVARRTHRFGRRLASEGQEVDDVGPPL